MPPVVRSAKLARTRALEAVGLERGIHVGAGRRAVVVGRQPAAADERGQVVDRRGWRIEGVLVEEERRKRACATAPPPTR